MPNAIEQRGFFWWFNDRDRPARSQETSIPGLLTVTADGRTSLDIDGTLIPDHELSDWSEPRTFDPAARIVGMLDIRGPYVLLEKLTRTDFSDIRTLTLKQSFAAQTCTQRDSPFPDDYNADNFTELHIDLKGLEDWLELNSITTMDEVGSDVERVQVEYTNHTYQSRTSGATVSIGSVTTGRNVFRIYREPVRSVHFDQSFYIKYRPDEPTNLSHMQYIFANVEQLLSMLLGAHFTLARPSFIRTEERLPSWNTVFARSDAQSSERFDRGFLLVRFRDIRDELGPLLQAWLNCSKLYGAGFYLYTASLRNSQFYMDGSLFDLVTGIEVLHRRSSNLETPQSSIQKKQQVDRILTSFSENDPDRKWLSKKLAHAHEPSLEERLLNSFRALPLRFGKSELEKFAKTCATQRNKIAHHGGPESEADYDTFKKQTLHLADALGYLFNCLILQKIGLADEHILRAMTKGWLARGPIKFAFAAVGLTIEP